MSREYTPDLWVIIQLTSEKGTHERVFASWYGGFTSGDSWKMSSGIESVTRDGVVFVMPQTSGSIYRCHKNNYGTSGYGGAVLSSYQKEADESNGQLSIRVLSEEEAMKYIEDHLNG
jgi:hypothetical protein